MSDEELELSDNEETNHKSELVAKSHNDESDSDPEPPKNDDYQADSYNAISDNDNDTHNDYGYNEEPAKSKSKKKSTKQKVELTPEQQAIDAEFESLLPRKAKRVVDDNPDEVSKINEARAKSLIEDMDRAYNQDYQSKIVKTTRTFARQMFLTKNLEPVSHDVELTKALIQSGVLDRFKTWIKGFPDGSLPTVTIVELILKCLASYKLDDEQIRTSGVVETVNAIDTKNTSPKVVDLRESLLSTWKRQLVQAKSGYEVQRSTTVDVNSDVTKAIKDSNYLRADELAKRQRNQEIRMKTLEDAGFKVDRPLLQPSEPLRILKSVDKVKGRH